MDVLIGNSYAVEQTEGALRPLYGPQQTYIRLPALGSQKTFQTITEVMKLHMRQGRSPNSIFTPDPDLTMALKAHYGIGGLNPILNIRTNSGTDFQSGVMGGASNGTGAFAPATYLAVSADVNPVVVTDLTLMGEILTGSLARTLATYAHTTGATSFTQTVVFTSDQTITLSKSGLFNIGSGGRVCWEELWIQPRLLTSGDQLSVSIQVNI
jgi:hypothetical protein